MPFTDAPGFRMYYEVHGDGRPPRAEGEFSAHRGTHPRGKTRFPGWRSPSPVRGGRGGVPSGGAGFPAQRLESVIVY